MAAGHRPCAECRRADYDRLKEIWSSIHPGQVGADAIDAQLHAERLRGSAGGRRFHRAPYEELPDGAFVMHEGVPALVLSRRLMRWSPAGYHDRGPQHKDGTATVITPPSLLALLSAGWSPLVPLLHPSAMGDGGQR